MIDFDAPIEWMLANLSGQIPGLKKFGRVLPAMKTSKQRADAAQVDGFFQFCRIGLYSARELPGGGNFTMWRAIYRLDLWHAYGVDGDKAINLWLPQVIAAIKAYPSLGDTVSSLVTVLPRRDPPDDMVGEIACSYGIVMVHTDIRDYS